MPKEFLKRWMPAPETLRDHKHLRLFARWLSEPNLWQLNRRSAASEDEEVCRRYFERRQNARAIEAVWNDGGEDGCCGWILKTDIPHESFMIVEEGEPFSRGIVFSLSSLTHATRKKEPQAHE